MRPWSAETFAERICPTFIENWPAALRDLSIRTLDLEVPEAELHAAVSYTRYRSWFHNLRPFQNLDGLRDRLERGLAVFPDGAFLRLGSRSPKDAHYAREIGLRVRSAADGLALLTTHSRRIAFDIRCALDYSYLPRLFLREWLTLPAWTEFRCFVEDGRLVGISQYDHRYLGPAPEIHRHAGAIEDSIRCFFEEIRPLLHLPSVVVDVFLDPEAATEDRFETRLLELNPFIVQTSPAMFSWAREGDFDGSFRYL